MAGDHFILDSDRRVVAATLMQWARWLQSAGEARVVGRTVVGHFEVSTVFLGLDHRMVETMDAGPPVLWETMVFDKGSRAAHDCQRCAGEWADAEAQHERVVAAVRAALGGAT
jgi:hypothetical protein